MVGPQGTQGDTGATGSTGAAGPTVRWLGPWNATAGYLKYDAVSFNSSSYLAINDVATNSSPGNQDPSVDTADWVLMAQAGATGATGATGAAGATGATGATGNTGDPGAQGPQGPQGIQGIQGAAGTNGTNGTNGATGATGAGYTATSTSSVTIGTGSQTFATQAGLAYSIGARARASSNANGANYMEGLVTAYDTSTGALTVNVDTIGGSGQHADWNINVAGNVGATGPAGSGVTTTGSPASGNLAAFSGSTSITSGNLSGDCTTSGNLAVTCTKTNGVSFAASATTNTTNASNITSGTLPHAQLPALVSGDIPNNAASTTGNAATATTATTATTAGTATTATSANGLQGVAVSSTTPTSNQVLTYNGTTVGTCGTQRRRFGHGPQHRYRVVAGCDDNEWDQCLRGSYCGRSCNELHHVCERHAYGYGDPLLELCPSRDEQLLDELHCQQWRGTQRLYRDVGLKRGHRHGLEVVRHTIRARLRRRDACPNQLQRDPRELHARDGHLLFGYRARR